MLVLPCLELVDVNVAQQHCRHRLGRWVNLEREKGFEPSTSCLEGSSSKCEIGPNLALNDVGRGEVSNGKKVSIAYL